MKIDLRRIFFIFTYLSTCVTVVADLKLTPTRPLEEAYFCAICETVEPGGYERQLAEKFPSMDFFRLKPLRIYWGSYENAKSSLLLHPVPKGQVSLPVLVVLRSEVGVEPGDWVKKYIPIAKDPKSPDYYLLTGDQHITKDKLMKVLDEISKGMQKRFPLDKEVAVPTGIQVPIQKEGLYPPAPPAVRPVRWDPARPTIRPMNGVRVHGLT